MIARYEERAALMTVETRPSLRDRILDAVLGKKVALTEEEIARRIGILPPRRVRIIRDWLTIPVLIATTLLVIRNYGWIDYPSALLDNWNSGLVLGGGVWFFLVRGLIDGHYEGAYDHRVAGKHQ